MAEQRAGGLLAGVERAERKKEQGLRSMLERSEIPVVTAHRWQAMSAVQTVDEAKEIRDQAEAIRIYARSARKGLAVQNRAAAVKILAEQRAGALLKDVERMQGKTGTGLRSMLERSEIPIVAAHRWQAMSVVPEERVRELEAELTADGKELTSVLILRLDGVGAQRQGTTPRTAKHAAVMTPRQKRRQALAEAVRVHARKLAGTYTRQNRMEWAASRRSEGWSARLVLDAISAGSLASVRARMDSSHSETPPPPRVAKAVAALALIDVQRDQQTRRGRYLETRLTRPPS